MNQIPEKLLKPYDPKETEERIYKTWEDGGFFNPEKNIADGYTAKDAKSYTIVLPPPNVTGTLHMGHSLMLALEDLLIRFHRMQGRRTLWIPGTDHASIATQSKVEKDISKKEGKNRHDIGREELLKRIEKFAQESHDIITNQVKRMGASVDWSREAFTLDAPRNLAVRTAFKKMYDDGLIYRGNRIVNWDPKGQTTISDDEIVYETRKAKFYTFKYAKDFPISISTTRPETKVGDTAVAVHPDDPRYKQYVGKNYEVIFAGVPLSIKIVADEEVDQDFGTGALGVTPAHSMVDWQIAQKNKLPVKQVINEYTKMTVDTPELKDKKVAEAREIIVAWLRKENLLEKEEEIDQNVATAERTGGIIEPLPKLQWFIDVNREYTDLAGQKTTLKKMMREKVESQQIKIIPEYFNKTYFYWIDNLRDWCISRQIWYGHRVPVWYKQNAGKEEIFCGIDAPSGDSWKQDEDTLDTWFSSGLWTFSTLGWPAKTEDLKIYHPTDVLETGYDILPFWVARMILMTGYHLNTIPFHTVYLHGLVRDMKGRKMSKSLGNGIDPMDVAEKFGADAGRMALIMSGSAGTDSKLSEEKIKGYKHFANKIWNIARFVVTSTADLSADTMSDDNSTVKILPTDQALIDALNAQVADITKDLEEYRFYMAGEKIYQYIWKEFADVIIEQSKPILAGHDTASKNSRQKTLLIILTTTLKVLHPFMPFVTEELWSLLASSGVIPKTHMLIVENWPIIK